MEEEMIGLYARTNTGKIFRFAWVENEKYILIITKSEYGYLNYDKYWLQKDEEIVKHSKNIIDLIEVGDYVNGLEVIDKSNEYWLYCGLKDDWTKQIPVNKEEIKRIVTKEQFANIQYRLEV